MEPEYQSHALSILLERDHEEAIAQIVAGFTSHEEHLRSLLIRHVDRLSGGLRICMTDDRLNARLAAIELIGAGGRARLADLLADAMLRPCRSTAAKAAAALLAITQSARSPTESRTRYASSRHPHPPHELDYLAEALKRSLAGWALHARPELILAAIRMAEPLESTILRLADQPRTKVARAFDREVWACAEPYVADYCLRALVSASLRDSAAHVLARSNDAAFRTALLSGAWLLADETVRKSCARVRNFACLPDDAGATLWRDASQARAAVRLIAAAGFRHGGKPALLTQLAMSENAGASRAAAWALIENRLDGGDDALAAIASSQASSLAKIAAIELRRRQGWRPAPPAGGAKELTSFGAPEVARGESMASAFDLYWSDFDKLAESDRAAIGRAVAAAMADFDRQLRARCAGASAKDRLRGLKIIRALDLFAPCAEVMSRAARDSDGVVRSLAVAMLGHFEAPAGQRILRDALDDRDPRVQANAIEALDRLGAEAPQDRMALKLVTSGGRVRANAVASLVRHKKREGVAGLLQMLNGGLVSDRVSGLWVVEHLRLVGAADRLGNMALHDPEPDVRLRAETVLLRLAEEPTDEHEVQVSGFPKFPSTGAGDGEPLDASFDQTRADDKRPEDPPWADGKPVARVRPWMPPEVTR
jgi:HEAT repeat protein